MDTTKPVHYSKNSSHQYSFGVEVLQQYMKWEEGDAVLDAGCGTGATCKYISQQPGVASVAGFDVSPDFISYASQHNPSPNILYHVADVSDVSTFKPEWQGAFSKAVSFFVLHWVRDKVSALKALHHCLKPRGEIVTCSTTDKSKILQTFTKMVAHPKWKIYLQHPVLLFPWPSSDVTNRLLMEECGFEVLSCQLKAAPEPFESKEKLKEFLGSIFPLLSYIPQDKRDEFLDDMEKMARETYVLSGLDGDYKVTEEYQVVQARKL
ncbi:juvenile hormone acid O-methyltransferase-like [Branchiostoma lanceolatum]|uniref:juvenile hormone acid O-methyltransferase-like n=1 Tax=Branchiostoma lanceolatum TaxID=7740 RepID=UPI003451BB62